MQSSSTSANQRRVKVLSMEPDKARSEPIKSQYISSFPSPLTQICHRFDLADFLLFHEENGVQA